MRFQAKEDFAQFYENPFYMEDLDEHVMPYCHVNTITPIFSKILLVFPLTFYKFCLN
jgi:hypothetical protein